MAIEPVPHIDYAPDPAPQRGDPDTFSDRVDALVQWWEDSPAQLNVLVDGVTHNANEALSSAEDAAASATLAQNAATGTVAAADLIATSTTSMTFGGGSKSFAIQPGKKFVEKMPVRLTPTGVGNRFLDGYVTSYDPATGNTVMQIQQGSGGGATTYANWTLMITGPISESAFQGGGGYTFYEDLVVDVAVFADSNSLQEASFGSGGAWVLDDPGNVPGGRQLWTLSNISTNSSNGDAIIKDISGNHLAYLASNRTTDVHLGQNGYVFPDASPVGKPFRYTGTASSRIAGAAGAFVRCVIVDADHLLFLVHGQSLHGVLYEISTNTWGALTLIRTSLSTTGAVDNVRAALIDVNTVIVASCDANSTAAQVVVLTTDGGVVLTPGTAQTTAFGVASARLLDWSLVGTSFVLSYVTSGNFVRMRVHTLSGTTVSVPGAEVQGPTGTAPPAMIDGPSGGGVIGLVTATATLLSVTPYLVSGTSLTAGTAATRTVTTVTGITLRKSLTGRWLLTYIASNVGSIAPISLGSGSATAAIAAGTAVSSSVTTVTSMQVQQYEFHAQTAVTGTDAAGGFVTEFALINDTGSGSLALLGSLWPRWSAAAQTVAPVGTSYDAGVGAAGTYACWMISSAKNTELQVFADSALSMVLKNVYRIGPSSVAAGIPPLALYPKQQLHHSVLHKNATTEFSTLGDGSKPAIFSADANSLATLRSNPILINDPVNGARGIDFSSIWVPYSYGNDAVLTLEQVRIA